MTLNKSCAIGSTAISLVLWGIMLVVGFSILDWIDDHTFFLEWLRQHFSRWIFTTLSVIANAWMLITWTRHFYNACNRPRFEVEARK